MMRRTLRRPASEMTVDKAYKRLFKATAAAKGLTIKEFSRILAEKNQAFMQEEKNEKQFKFKL